MFNFTLSFYFDMRRVTKFNSKCKRILKKLELQLENNLNRMLAIFFFFCNLCVFFFQYFLRVRNKLLVIMAYTRISITMPTNKNYYNNCNNNNTKMKKKLLATIIIKTKRHFFSCFFSKREKFFFFKMYSLFFSANGKWWELLYMYKTITTK